MCSAAFWFMPLPMSPPPPLAKTGADIAVSRSTMHASTRKFLILIVPPVNSFVAFKYNVYSKPFFFSKNSSCEFHQKRTSPQETIMQKTCFLS
jgi:hypothetical protein